MHHLIPDADLRILVLATERLARLAYDRELQELLEGVTAKYRALVDVEEWHEEAPCTT